ncbi:MAG TPA: helix-turn-helix transcriptional regulator [Acidimicrobiales bacterium]
MQSNPLMTTENWERRFGAEVRRLRRRLELTQAELAERANVSSSSIKYLEAGKGSSLATVVRVAKALGRVDWLEAFTPPEPAVSPMALLRTRQLSEQRATSRVRHSLGAKEST